MPDLPDCDVEHTSRAQRRTDEQIARVASRQGGVVHRRQLIALGLTAREIGHRIETGRLRVVYRGVYAVGHDAIPVRGRLCAALLLAPCPRGLSYRTATALHKLIPSMPPFIDVTVTTCRPRNRHDVVFHKATSLELTTVHGLPVTTVARTLQDLAATRPEPEVRTALNQAFVQRLITPDELHARTGPGAGTLRRLAGLAPTRSQLERRFLRALRDDSALPDPVTDHPIGRYIADFYWPDHGLIVETDSRRYHGGPIAFTHDRVRDAELAIRDLVVIRVTDEQVDHDLPATLDRLRRWFDGPGRRRRAA